MLHSLRHNSLICRNHKHDHIHSSHACQHIFYKFFMAGHIHDPYPLPFREIHPGKTKFNGNAPFFFFLQTVCINTRQCPDQTGLSVIHMTCRSYNSIFHQFNPCKNRRGKPVRLDCISFFLIIPHVCFFYYRNASPYQVE